MQTILTQPVLLGVAAVVVAIAKLVWAIRRRA